MPDKKYDLSPLREKIEDAIEALAILQAAYKDLTGQVWVPPIRLAPRKRREAADQEWTIKEMLFRIKSEAEVVDGMLEAANAPGEFVSGMRDIDNICEDLLLRLEDEEERRLDPPTHLPRHIVPVIGLRPYLEVEE